MTLNFLIFDRGVSSQYSQAERAIEKQQTLDLALLFLFAGGAAAIEKRYRHVECIGDLLQPVGTDAIDALFVFLHLLKADTKFFAEVRLRDFHLDAAQPNPFSQFDVAFDS